MFRCKKDVDEIKQLKETIEKEDTNVDIGAGGDGGVKKDGKIGEGADAGGYDDADADVQLEVVEPYAFKDQDLSALTVEHIPPGTTEIQAGAFEGNNLRELTTLPTSLRKIGKGAFRGNRGLKKVVIPEGVTDIDDNAFTSCSSITSLTLPSTLKRIGKSAFGTHGSGELAVLVLPEGLLSIDVGAFQYNKLTALVIPKSVKTIGDSAFRGQTKITKVTITSELYETIKAAGKSVTSRGMETSGDKMGLINVFGNRSVTFVDHDGNSLAYPA